MVCDSVDRCGYQRIRSCALVYSPSLEGLEMRIDVREVVQTRTTRPYVDYCWLQGSLCR